MSENVDTPRDAVGPRGSSAASADAGAANAGGTLLFCAFEPSGDAHAAPVVASLLARRPGLAVEAWGGRHLEGAGARLLGETAREGAMGVHALARIRFVRDIVRAASARLAAGDRPDAFVAVDSPAANFPVCRAAKRAGVPVVHLVAPQLWAWAPWRARKLRRRTDLVLCLLPFEPAWLERRGIPARFVGHPRVNRTIEIATPITDAGDPKVGLFPGSRPHEIDANLDWILAAWRAIRDRHAGASAIVAAVDEDAERTLRARIAGADLERLRFAVAASDEVAAWADLAVTVSGTMSLDLAVHGTPMVGLYRVSRLSRLAARLLLTTPYRLLPNVVAGRGIVPEFVPWAGPEGPIVEAALALAGDPERRARQRADLAAVRDAFAGHDPESEAAEAILEVIDHARD